MFTGKYYHALDAKSRMFVPAKFRSELGASFHITRDIDGSLIALSTVEWEKFIDKILSLPASQTLEIREFYSQAESEVTPDAQGRVALSAEQKEYIGADVDAAKNLVVVGDFDRIKIWSEETWVKKQAQTKPADILSAMKDLGI